MKEERILNTLGMVDDRFIAEAAPGAVQKPRPVLRRAIILAAALALMLALAAAAYGANWLGLRDLLLPVFTQGADRDLGPAAVIGLTGYQGSPEWQALAEWTAFLDRYDPEGQIFQETQGRLDSSFARYSCYQVYSREMAGNMERIAENYGLKLHTTVYDPQKQPELLRLPKDFLGGQAAYYSDLYEDGSFQAEGTVQLGDIGAWDFLLLRSVRGTFHDAMVDLGDAAQYREAPYVAACGTPVLLALGADRGLVLADLPDCFVTVQISYGRDSGITLEHLQVLADSINFAALTPVLRPQSQEPAAPGVSRVREVYGAVLRDLLHSGLLPDGSRAEAPGSAGSRFAVGDVDRDGREELVLLYDPGTVAGALGYILGYDEEAGRIHIQLQEFPAFVFLENGSMKALASHDQTGGTLWPYTLYRYLPEQDCYAPAGHVHTEVQEGSPVYYLGEETWGTQPVDEAAYRSWLQQRQGNGPEQILKDMPLTEDAILALLEAAPEIAPT